MRQKRRVPLSAGGAGTEFELLERPVEQRELESFDARIVDIAGAQGIQIVARQHLRVVGFAQLGDRTRACIEGGGLDGRRADRVVRAVLLAGLVDRQDLDEPEAVRSRPIHKLAQGGHVADAEVVRAPEREQGRENTGNLVIGMERGQDGHRSLRIAECPGKTPPSRAAKGAAAPATFIARCSLSRPTPRPPPCRR
jgi:hypothetical protein